VGGERTMRGSTMTEDTTVPAAGTGEALTQQQRRDLGCECVRLDNEWHHVRFCRVPVVERILADRRAAEGDLRARIVALADDLKVLALTLDHPSEEEPTRARGVTIGYCVDRLWAALAQPTTDDA
jgi:hypothetical protein